MHFIISTVGYVVSIAGAMYVVSDYYPKGADGLGGYFLVILLGIFALLALINMIIAIALEKKRDTKILYCIILSTLLILSYIMITNYFFVTDFSLPVEEMSVDEISADTVIE
jgi:hypothetical protein